MAPRTEIEWLNSQGFTAIFKTTMLLILSPNCTYIFVIYCSSQETKIKQAAHTKVEEYPEIEKFIPYDPLGNYDIS